jgi:hypothetical protein
MEQEVGMGCRSQRILETAQNEESMTFQDFLLDKLVSHRIESTIKRRLIVLRFFSLPE